MKATQYDRDLLKIRVHEAVARAQARHDMPRGVEAKKAMVDVIAVSLGTLAQVAAGGDRRPFTEDTVIIGLLDPLRMPIQINKVEGFLCNDPKRIVEDVMGALLDSYERMVENDLSR